MPYVPDDDRITLAALEYLQSRAGAELRQDVAALASAAAPSVAEVAALRKHRPPEAVHAALVLAKLQPKAAGARGKFPALGFVWATPEALEQATHMAVGRYKAERLAAMGAQHIYDVCAGIGGDTLAFAGRMPVTAVELSPVRAKCLQLNLLETSESLHRVDVQTADIAAIIPHLPAGGGGGWVHIDPARRSGGKRSARYEDLIPGPEVLARIMARPGIRMAIKLSPAVDFDSLPAGHVELISHHGSVVQALLWVGTTQSATERTATVLNGGTFQLTAQTRQVNVVPAPVVTFPDPRLLYEVDGAITRAGLAWRVAELSGLLPLTLDGGYLLSSAPGECGRQRLFAGVGTAGPATARAPAAGPASATVGGLKDMNFRGALTAFDIHAIVPYSRAAEMIRALPPSAAGSVEVKCRGHVPGVETDALQDQWTQARGPRGGCVALLFRENKRILAAVGFRVNDGIKRSGVG